MKKFMSLFFVLAFAAVLAGPMIPAPAFAEKYESVTVTATDVQTTWTVLEGSTLKHNAFRIYERSGQLDLEICGGGNTNDASAYYITVPHGTQYSNEIYKGTTGTYVRGTTTATVEFESKRPASYWPWR